MEAAARPAVRTVAVVGLGYVGLPVALGFGQHLPTIGYDLSREKVLAYRRGEDPAREVDATEFARARHLRFTDEAGELAEADVIIVAVPTPVDAARVPDFGHLVGASEVVGRNMKAGAIVVYESTVYPGATEEICVPVLEKHSGRRWKEGFHVGYSPERINPGDREHTLARIVKVVAGDDAATLETLATLYARVVEAGIHRASSIAVAEAAKVIENTQRDLNISLMNELALIFHRLGLDTTEVLAAARTKWNFLPFRPGLVGGHCIGVDPYYLTHKAGLVDYHPQVILAGRRINDDMAAWVAQQVVKRLIHRGVAVRGSTVNVLGLTFKENCRDVRNSKVADLVAELESFGCKVNVHDPLAFGEMAHEEYGIGLVGWDALPQADALVVAVAHESFMKRPLADLFAKLKPQGVFADVKSAFDRDAVRAAGYDLWRM